VRDAENVSYDPDEGLSEDQLNEVDTLVDGRPVVAICGGRVSDVDAVRVRVGRARLRRHLGRHRRYGGVEQTLRGRPHRDVQRRPRRSAGPAPSEGLSRLRRRLEGGWRGRRGRCHQTDRPVQSRCAGRWPLHSARARYARPRRPHLGQSDPRRRGWRALPPRRRSSRARCRVRIRPATGWRRHRSRRRRDRGAPHARPPRR